MADKRMFNRCIVESDQFLDMPTEAQCLYFHLCMHSDDDGICDNPRTVMRQCGASNDSMKILIAKKYVLTFEKNDGFIIVIKHWRLNNYIRKDTYHETKYKELMRELYFDENQSYSTNPGDGHTPCLPSPSRGCDEVVTGSSRVRDESLTQNRLDKNRLDKISIEQYREEECVPEDPFEIFWAAYPKKVGIEAAREAFAKCTQPLDILLNAIEKQKQSVQWNKADGRYIPNPSTWLTQGRWNDEVEAAVGKATATAQSESFRKSVSKFMSEEW